MTIQKILDLAIVFGAATGFGLGVTVGLGYLSIIKSKLMR